MKKLLIIALLSTIQFAFSQRGTVNGTLTDRDMGGEPLPFANVLIKGTTIGGTTDMDGKFSISAPAGKQTIIFSFVGYETVEKPITVVAGKTIVLNQELGAAKGNTLENVTITGTVSKEKESALLLDQKKAAVIKESIGAVELSKKGVSDAAAAASKISGVKQSEGSGDVYVRGLGDRYLSTTFNGLPIPSDDVDNKNIDLKLFSTGIIQNVGISKTYNTENYADQASGTVDVVSKEFSKKKYAVSLSSGANLNVLDAENYRLTAIHDDVRFGFFSNDSNLETRVYNQPWNPTSVKFPVDYSLSFTANDKLSDKIKLSSSVSYSKSNGYRKGLFKRYKSNIIYNDFDDAERSSQKTNLTGFLGLQYKINDKNDLKYAGLFVNKGEQVLYEQGRDGNGTIFDELPTEYTFMRDQNFKQTKLFINQLFGKHKLGEKNTVKWGAGYNLLFADEPNRILNQLNKTNQTGSNPPSEIYQYSSQQNFYQRKSAQFIEDTEINGYIKDEFVLSDTDNGKNKINFGANIRIKNRDFENEFAGIDIDARNPQRTNSIDDINAFFYTQTVFEGNPALSIDLRAKDIYTGTANYYAGFANFDFVTNFKLSGNVGVRYEMNTIEVDYDVANSTPDKVTKEYTGFYPSANLKYELNEKNFIRLASSLTQTLPEFKEIAPFQYNSPSGRITKGSPEIEKSDVLNIDLKYEFFPSRTQLVSATVFYKNIKDPINLTQQTSAAGDLIFINTGDKAKVYGFEIEAKVDILKNEDEKAVLSANGNFSRLWHEQDLLDKYQYKNITTSKLQGASDYIGNISLSYNTQTEFPFIVTVTGNYNSDNIFALGVPEDQANKANDFTEAIVEKGFVTLDLVASKKINEHLSIKLSGKNLLDPKIEQTQLVNNVTELVQSYTKGKSLSLGLSYQF